MALNEVTLTTFEMNILVSRLKGTSGPANDHMTALGYEGRVLSEESAVRLDEYLTQCDGCGEWTDETWEMCGQNLCDDCLEDE